MILNAVSFGSVRFERLATRFGSMQQLRRLLLKSSSSNSLKILSKLYQDTSNTRNAWKAQAYSEEEHKG